MENNSTENKVDRILGSIDKLKKAAAPDFFYTRLIGRMQQEREPKRKPFILLRPVFVTAALSVVLIINIVSLTQMNKQPEQKAVIQTDKPATIESFAKAYNLDMETLYQ